MTMSEISKHVPKAEKHRCVFKDNNYSLAALISVLTLLCILLKLAQPWGSFGFSVTIMHVIFQISSNPQRTFRSNALSAKRSLFVNNL